MKSSPSRNEHRLGDLLRYWRQQRNKSQLDLSLDARVSQRHISFVESGRSVPSRKLLLLLARTLDVPLRERNLLLSAAGYAPVYREETWDAPEMAALNEAVDRMLTQQEPHPALLLDRYWNVLRTNEAAPRFFGSYVDLSTRKPPRNLLHLMFDPRGMRPFIDNWDEVASGLLDRVYRECVGRVPDEKTAELLRELKRYPGVEDLGSNPKPGGPVLAITFRRGTERISYFSLISTVGMPQTVTAQEFRIESMFPVRG